MGSHRTSPMGHGRQKTVWCVALRIGLLLAGLEGLEVAVSRQWLPMARQPSRPPGPQPMWVLLWDCLQAQRARCQANVIDNLSGCIRTCLKVRPLLPRRQPVLRRLLSAPVWDLWVAAVPVQKRSRADTNICLCMLFRNARRQLPPPAQQQLPLEAAHLPKSDDASPLAGRPHFIAPYRPAAMTGNDMPVVL